MGYTKWECEGFSERNRVAAGSQRKEPHCRRDYSFTSRKITKRKRLQGPACDSFRRLGQSGSRGKSHRDLGPIAANSASAYANRDTLRLASPNRQACHGGQRLEPSSDKRATEGKGWSLRLHLQAVYISANDMCITTIFQPS